MPISVRFGVVLIVGIAIICQDKVNAGDYYSKAGPLGTVKIGPDAEGASEVDRVFGKEYSHTDWFSVYHGLAPHAMGDPNLVNVEDHDAYGTPDPLQVVSWDGKAGGPEGNSGSVDAFNYGSHGFNLENGQVDALAHHNDFLFDQVVGNTATLLFSTTADLDASTVLPPAGSGSDVGVVAKAHVHFEDPKGPDAMSPLDVWAVIETGSAGPGPGPGVNHHVVEDLDALEVCGPEPPSHTDGATRVHEGYIGGLGGPNTADADRFSLDGDSSSGTSVWAYDIPTGFVAPYISHADIVAAVEELFLGPGMEFTPETRHQIDVDGTMVKDLGEASPTSPLWDPGDELLFTIDPVDTMIPDPASPTLPPIAGPKIDGGEIMVLTKLAPGVGPGTFAIKFLSHGGHDWDTAFDVSGTFGYEFEDVDALEAVGTQNGGTDIDTPEPTGLALLLIGLVGAGCFRRR